MRRALIWGMVGVGILLLRETRADDSPATKPVKSVAPLALKTDESLRSDVEKSIHVQVLRDMRDTTLVELMIQVDHPPVGMGFNVTMNANGVIIPVGTVAWATEMDRWDFDIDVPPNVKTVDFELTPDPVGAAHLRQNNMFELASLHTIWNGTVTLQGTKISDQRIGGMFPVGPPITQVALDEQTQLLDGDDAVIQQFKRDGDIAKARGQLEHAVQEAPKNVSAWFNLGCLAIASNDYGHAVSLFAKVRQIDSSSPLADKAQRQLRRIGGYLTNLVGRDDVPSMYILGNMFEFGWGPGLDRQSAKMWYRTAANAGNADAMVRLAVMYGQDLAAGPSDPKAKEWYEQQVIEMYRQAAAAGNMEAQKWVASHNQH